MQIKEKINQIISDENLSVNERLLKICHFLDEEFSHFNWTGFYFKNGDKNELILGAYVGEETEHTIIPYGRGICGQVAVSGETFLIDDVYSQDNYLACSVKTKSEIVVPIFKNGQNIGQIDIDSHTPNAFSQEDKNLLEWLCQRVATIL